MSTLQYDRTDAKSSTIPDAVIASSPLIPNWIVLSVYLFMYRNNYTAEI